MTMTGIQLFQTLKTKMGEREAEALVNYVDNTVKENNKDIQEANLKTLATKADLFVVKEDILAVKGDLAAVKQDVIGVKGDLAAIKKDITAVKQDITAVKQDVASVKQDVAGVKIDLASVKTDLAKVEGRLETKIADVKSDVIRWMFAFFVTMLLAIIGLYFKH